MFDQEALKLVERLGKLQHFFRGVLPDDFLGAAVNHLDDGFSEFLVDGKLKVLVLCADELLNVVDGLFDIFLLKFGD